MTVTALAALLLVVGLVVAAWAARGELRHDPGRARDLDPEAMASWHRAMEAVRRVTHPPRWDR